MTARFRNRLLSAVAVVVASLTIASTASAQPVEAFTIGDLNAFVGDHVEFWGAQWWKLNTPSLGPAPPSFKGWATTVTMTGECSGTFSTEPGNSSDPPPTIPPFMEVLAVNKVTKSGAVISGTFDGIAFVQTDPGYAPDPGHPGTGQVTGFCSGGEIQ